MPKKLKKPTAKPLLLIEWVDAEDRPGWIEGEIPAAPRFFSVGWLIKETKESIHMAASAPSTAGDAFGTLMTIPKGMIIRKKALKCPLTIL